MSSYVVRRRPRSSSLLTWSSGGYVWATPTLAPPVVVDRVAACDLVDRYGGVVEVTS